MPLKLTKRPGSPHWQIHGTASGIRYRFSSQTDCRDTAEALRRKTEREAAERRAHGDAHVSTFAQCCIHYIKTGGDVRYLERLVRRWGSWRISQITSAELARAAHELYPGRSTAYHVRAVYTPANAVLNAAAEAGLCTWTHVRPPAVRRKPVTAASDDHIARLLPHCSPNLAALIMFLTLTGARIGEACRLEWAHVDFERGEALLERTKTGGSRRVPLTVDVVSALRAVAELRPQSGRVFGYADRWSARNAIKAASARAGVDYLSSHKIGRHAFASRLLRDGHSLPVVTAAGGWASPSMVTSVYGHLERSHVDGAVRGSRLLPRG